MDKRQRTWIFLGIILVVAIFFRFWQFTEFPPGLYPDEAVNGVNGLQAVETGNYQVFYPDNNGREGLWMNVQGLVSKALGPSPWALRVPSMVIGVLTVLGLFLLVRELVGDEVALVSAALLATSFWHTVFSRMAFRAILLPFVLTYLFYFLVRGLKRGRGSDFVGAGFFFGLGFHTYISYRIVPLLLVALFGVLIWLKRRKVWQPIFCAPCAVSLMLIVGLVVATPMLLYLIQHPEDWSGRTGGISVWSAQSPLKAVLISTAATLGQFNVLGDRNWRHNFPGRPELFWPAGIMMLVGLAITFRTAFRIFRAKPAAPPSEETVRPCHSNILVYDSGNGWLVIFGAWLMLGWFFALMVPAILTREGLPHALRTIGTIPPAYAFAGVGTWLTWKALRRKVLGGLEGFLERDPNLEFLRSRLNRIRRWFGVLLATFLLWVAGSEGVTYFVRWAPHPRVADAFAAHQTELANYINAAEPDISIYVVVNAPSLNVNGISLNAQPLVYLNHGRPNLFFVTPETIGSIPRDLHRAEIILLDSDRQFLAQLQRERYPQGKTKAVSGTIVPLVIP
ncbi:glycosyltransferase family 39 protein [Candidatus Parcubacteria bacterium]|nr:glycosyltransferase family 39 protein [Candidatus Parcubacteria bacterium]